jgi:hypothetical protein
VRKPFLVCWKRHTPPVHKIWVREIFFIILHYKYPKKLYTSKTEYYNSCFAKLRAISNLFSFFLYTLYIYIIHCMSTVLHRNNTAVRSRFVRFAVAVRAVCGRGSCGLWLRFVQFAVAVRAVCGRGSCNLRLRFFTDRRKLWRRVPTFPDYNGYHTLSNYKIYISILRLYL